MVAWGQLWGVFLPFASCGLFREDGMRAIETNKITAFDAGRTRSLHWWRRWPGASEFRRWA